MRPAWVRPGDLTYLQLLLYQRQTCGLEGRRRSLAAQIVKEKKKLLDEGVSSFDVEALCARIGVRKCSGCGRPMPGFSLQVR